MKNKLSFWEKLKAYRLKNNVVIVVILFAIVVLSVLIYLSPQARHNDVSANILMAVFTSFLATIMSLVAEIYQCQGGRQLFSGALCDLSGEGRYGEQGVFHLLYG